MNKRIWPDHIRNIYGTPAEFRKKKRLEVRVAERALLQLLRGCAFTQGGRDIVIALNAIREAKKKLSVKNFHKML